MRNDRVKTIMSKSQQRPCSSKYITRKSNLDDNIINLNISEPDIPKKQENIDQIHTY